MKSKVLMIFSIVMLLSACDSDDSRLGDAENVDLGKKTFDQNCAACHGIDARGLVENWNEVLADGTYPPPPLNGSAHTWHHAPQVLLRIINEGGSRSGGVMPAFKNRLDAQEKRAVLDYLFNLWPQEIQNAYRKRFK